jgi:hypothetical protein
MPIHTYTRREKLKHAQEHNHLDLRYTALQYQVPNSVLVVSIYGSATLVDFSFLIHAQSVHGLPTHTTTQTQNKRIQTFMPRVAIEPTIPVFERAKTVHVSDRAATVVGSVCTASY